MYDTLRIVASATMGLTLHCAKCHSHKYDPIPQSEYYRMQAIFMSAYRPGQWVPQVQRRLLEATAQQEKEAAAHNARLDAAIAKVNQQKADLQKQFAERLFSERLAKLPPQLRDDVKTALSAEPAKRSEIQKYLAAKLKQNCVHRPQNWSRRLQRRIPILPVIIPSSTRPFKRRRRRNRHFPKFA